MCIECFGTKCILEARLGRQMLGCKQNQFRTFSWLRLKYIFLCLFDCQRLTFLTVLLLNAELQAPRIETLTLLGSMLYILGQYGNLSLPVPVSEGDSVLGAHLKVWPTLLLISSFFLLCLCSLLFHSLSPFSFWASYLSSFGMLNHSLFLPHISWGWCPHCLTQLVGSRREIPGKLFVAWSVGYVVLLYAAHVMKSMRGTWVGWTAGQARMRSSGK